MAKKFGVAFSAEFGVPEIWFKKNKVFDATLDVDSPLFIDPFLLQKSKHKEFSTCGFEAYEKHFQKIHDALAACKKEGDPLWVGALRRFRFSEEKGMGGTCLGYSTTTSGRGFGKVLSRNALAWAKQVIDLGVVDPDLFSIMSVFQDGIGPDRISDMLLNITLDCVIDFNKHMLAKIEKDTGVKIKTVGCTLRNLHTRLPRNRFSGKPIILVASDVLRHLPMMDNARGLRAVAEFNEAFRDRVNEHLGEVFRIRGKEDKDEIRRQAMESAAAFQTFLDLLKVMEAEPYNVFKDPKGLWQWRTNAALFAAAFGHGFKDDPTLSEIERIDRVCLAIIEEFRHAVEDRRLWRVFYVDQEPREERYAQLLFTAVASAFCVANNIDMSPEANGGAGPVDFKFSSGNAKIVIEMKLSTNQKLPEGYRKQLEAYKKAERTHHGHYVVVDVGRMGEKWDTLQRINQENAKFAKLSKLHLIDGTWRASASKL